MNKVKPMKKIVLLFVVAIFNAKALFAIDFQTDIDRFMKTYVNDGYVDYQAIKKAELDVLLDNLAAVPLFELDSNSQKALMINAYNLFAIREVLRHYPVTSVREVFDFFTFTRYKLGGSLYTLSQLEEAIFARFEDERVHFALVCASRGCPPLPSFGFNGADIERQLDERCRLIFNDKDFIYIDDAQYTVYFSELFNWYQKDFGPDLFDYVNHYRRAELPKHYKTAYYRYGWTLNDLAFVTGKKQKKTKTRYTDD
jgi:hypothetical protein